MTSQPSDQCQTPRIKSGTLDFHHVADVGWDIDLQAVRAILERNETKEGDIHLVKELPHLSLTPPPLVLGLGKSYNLSAEHLPPIEKATCAVADFGALSLRLRMKLDGLDLEQVKRLSSRIADEKVLTSCGEQLVRRVLEEIEPAVTRPFIRRFEEYQIFHLASLEQGDPIGLVAEHRSALAHILRAELQNLHPEQIDDALSLAKSYLAGDRTLIDTRAAVLLGNADFKDVQTVLAFAVVELLELRVLDDLLSERLTEPLKDNPLLPAAAPEFPRRRFNLRELEDLETAAAIQYNRITNPFRLLDDHFLADVYRLAAKRAGLEPWAKEVETNLSIIRGITENLIQEKHNRRALLLEAAVLLVIIYEAFHLDIPTVLQKWLSGQ